MALFGLTAASGVCGVLGAGSATSGFSTTGAAAVAPSPAAAGALVSGLSTGFPGESLNCWTLAGFFVASASGLSGLLALEFEASLLSASSSLCRTLNVFRKDICG